MAKAKSKRKKMSSKNHRKPKPRTGDHVRTAVNSARAMRIDITAADIEGGTALDPTSCAAAQAILRQTGASEVRVHRQMTYLKFGDKWTRFKTTAALSRETVVFDRGGRFIPGEYDLKPVPLRKLLGPEKLSPSRGYKPKQAKLRTRRLAIPGVRRTANARSDD